MAAKGRVRKRLRKLQTSLKRFVAKTTGRRAEKLRDASKDVRKALD